MLECQQEATILAELKACSKTKDLVRGKRIHAEVVQLGQDASAYVASALINMYARCGSMADAHLVFDRMEHPNVVPWTTLILGYAAHGQGLTALDLFTRMTNEGSTPDSVTFVAALKACTSLVVKKGGTECRDLGKEIYTLAVENYCDANVYVQSALIDLYAKCGSMVDAGQVFETMKHPNIVSWNVLIMGYADNGQGLIALEFFTRMRDRSKDGGPKPDGITFLAALKACISLVVEKGASGWTECRQRGRQIYNLVLENDCNADMYIQSTLINLFSNCDSMADARQVFESMKHPDVVSWTTLIMGYADNGQGLIALSIFNEMKRQGPPPNSITFVAALKAFGLVGGLESGRKLHSQICKCNDLNVVLVTCLVDFYVKCGSLVEARSVFDLHAQARDMITWTALLAGFSNIGDDESMFELFQEMQDAGFHPNSVTFLSMITGCGHAGLVEKGKECFDTMCTKYGIFPHLGHYNAMLDIFGRANKLADAMALLQGMSCSPNDVTWTTILDACRRWKNVEVGRLAFQSIYINDTDAAAYVLMGQIYGSKGMFQEQAIVLEMIKNLRACRRMEETYWTNEVGDVHTFVG